MAETNDKQCSSCSELQRLEHIVNEHDKKLEIHDKQLTEVTGKFELINFKLNLLMGIFAAIGTVLVGIIVNQWFV